MRRPIKALLASALCAVPLAAAAQQSRPDFPPCITVSAYARYGAYGYDHLVTIDNGCDRGAECIVRTNVSPDPIAVRVEAAERETVVTFRGSPASEFSARVRCNLDR